MSLKKRFFNKTSLLQVEPGKEKPWESFEGLSAVKFWELLPELFLLHGEEDLIPITTMVGDKLPETESECQMYIESTKVRVLRKTLKAVEWVNGICPWCMGERKHSDDCDRQAILIATEKEWVPPREEPEYDDDSEQEITVIFPDFQGE
jgi:hypothetical protein